MAIGQLELDVLHAASRPLETPQDHRSQAVGAAAAVLVVASMGFWTLHERPAAPASPSSGALPTLATAPERAPELLVPYAVGNERSADDDGLISFSGKTPETSVAGWVSAASAFVASAARSAVSRFYEGPHMVELAPPPPPRLKPLPSLSGFAVSVMKGQEPLTLVNGDARLSRLEAIKNGLGPSGRVETETWTDLCRGSRRYACATDTLGRPTIHDARDGSTRTHLSYDEAAPAGLRNLALVQMPTGRRAVELENLPTVGEPLVFDLSGEGVRTSNRVVYFDINGDGWAVKVRDISSGCALLVFDADHDGDAGGLGGREVFGHFSKITGAPSELYLDGFDALRAFVEKAERQGRLPAGTLERGVLDAEALARLHRFYGLGFRVGGLRHETVSPKEAGVHSITLSRAPSQRLFNFDGQGNDVMRRDGATFVTSDGSTRSYEDIFFVYDQPSFRFFAAGR